MLAQTYPHIEVIISDNNSSDNTEEVVSGFSDSRIRYIRQAKNIGANNNWNFCLEQASGGYFLLLHDDDLIDADHIETCMKSVAYESGIGLIRTGIRWIDSNGVVAHAKHNPATGLSTEEFFTAWFDGKVPMHLCGTIFNTKYLRAIGGFKQDFHPFQDVLAEVELAARFGRVDVLDIKASFRQHDSSQTRAQHLETWCKASGRLLEVMCSLVSNYKPIFRKKGLRFFAKHNYKLAREIKSPVARMRAYMVVFYHFGHFQTWLILVTSRINAFRDLWHLSKKIKRTIT
ncbi:MAG: hypothetical protein NPIRA02_38680 [Nitrospirales bacterium]|nr:MAG: hypothetical protein NPIRA02_38680 [Nitrospirales bacterium]